MIGSIEETLLVVNLFLLMSLLANANNDIHLSYQASLVDPESVLVQDILANIPVDTCDSIIVSPSTYQCKLRTIL